MTPILAPLVSLFRRARLELEETPTSRRIVAEGLAGIIAAFWLESSRSESRLAEHKAKILGVQTRLRPIKKRTDE